MYPFSTSGQDVVTNQFFIDRMEAAEGMDEETAALVQERERGTAEKDDLLLGSPTECLRAYILRYFGGYGDNLLRKLLELSYTI